MKTTFKEEQKFRQWWLWVLLLGMGMFFVIGLYKYFFIKQDFNNNADSNIDLFIFSAVILSVIILFIILKLKTEIDQKGIKVHFYPFFKKTLKWENIKSAKVLNYGFVGGWGIRLWTAYGNIYNISGNKGVAIELKNGKKLLIGTQKEEELKIILKKYLK